MTGPRLDAAAMRILHTADWHVGKKLGRIDRTKETEAVLDELVEVTRSAEVDLVIVAGDLFDRSLPPFLSLKLVLETLVRLADTGAHVVAIPGNHDSSDLFSVLGPHLRHSGVSLVHKALRPEAGGVLRVGARDGSSSAQVACFPFLHEAHVVDFMGDEDDRHKSYAERVRAICSRYASYMHDNSDRATVDVLVGHFMIHGAVPSGSERELHIGEAYMARAEAIPAQVHYAALGHIHRAQPAPGAEASARYSGSLMQLDFGEAGSDKGVLLVEVTADGKRVIEEVPIIAGRSLLKVRDTLEGLRARAAELAGAVVAVEVVTDGPYPGLADEVRSFLPDALYVRADYERTEDDRSDRDALTLSDLYGEFHRVRYGTDTPLELRAAFEELRSEVGAEL